MQLIVEPLEKAAEHVGLSFDFILNRLRANQRRLAITVDILARRGFMLSSADILEIGSHIGFGLSLIETTGMCVGLEYYHQNCISAKTLATCLGKMNTRYVQGTAAALPYSANTFDFVQSHHVIEHLSPEIWPYYLSEMARVVRPNGICFVSFPQRHYPIEGHYGLPFLHWLPKRLRQPYARLTPRYRHIHEAEKTYAQTSNGREDLVFTEFPRTSEFMEMAQRCFVTIDDVTQEFAAHPRMAEILRPTQHKLVTLLADTWICPERKLLLRKE